MSLTTVPLDAAYKDRTRLKVRERRHKGSIRLRMERRRYPKTTMTKGTGTDQIWATGPSSNNSPVQLTTTMMTIMSKAGTVATQPKTRLRLRRMGQISTPYPLTGIRSLSTSTCRLIRCRIKPNVDLAASRRCLGPSLSLICAIHRRLCLRWQEIFPRSP